MVLGGRATQRGAALGANWYLSVRPNRKRDIVDIKTPPMVVRAIASSVVLAIIMMEDVVCCMLVLCCVSV